MLNYHNVHSRRGFLIIELLFALLILSALGVTILTLSSRHLRGVGALNTSLRPKCDHPSCANAAPLATCACAHEAWKVIVE